jgi:hypothetical protein
VGTRSERHLVRSPVIHHEREPIDRRAGAACASREELVKGGRVSDIKSRGGRSSACDQQVHGQVATGRAIVESSASTFTSVYHSGRAYRGLTRGGCIS